MIDFLQYACMSFGLCCACGLLLNQVCLGGPIPMQNFVVWAGVAVANGLTVVVLGKGVFK